MAIDGATAVLTWLMTNGRGEQLPSLEELLGRPGWMELAACAGQPTELERRRLRAVA